MSKNFVFLFFFLCILSNSFAQTDTTFQKLISLNDSEKKVEKLNEEAENLWKIGDYSKSLKFSFEAQKSAKKINYFKGEAYAFNNIGIAYDYQGEYAKSLDYYFKALPLQKKIKDETGLAYTYNNMGLIYSNQFNFDEALKYYYQAMYLRKKNNDQSGLSSVYNNIGIVQMEQKNYKEALKNYQASVKIDSTLNDIYGMSAANSNIGMIYMELGDFQTALHYFNKALKIREQLNDKRGIANSSNNIGTIYEKQKKYPEAISKFKRALNIGLEIGAKDLVQYSYQQLHTVYDAQGDKGKSLENYKNFILYRDSINNELNTKKQTEAEMQFKFDQLKAEEKLKAEKDKLVADQEKQKQTYLLWSLIAILFLVLLFSWFLNKRWQIEKRQKHVIEAQKHLVEDKNREILDSITYAKRIQSAILPPDKIVKEYLAESFILYKPKDIVAGDFYWIEPFEEEIIFAVADCTGHGVPGALVSIVCHNALNRSVREFKLKSPSDILDKTRELIINEFQKSDELVNDGMDISICKLNLTTHILDWAGANSPLWISKPDQNELIELKPSKQPIGQFTSYLPFNTTTIQLEKKDTIYLFSDGYADQFGGENGKKMKSKQMKELFIFIKDQTMAEQRISIDNFFEKWKSNLEQLDDVCVIGIRI